MRDMNFVEKYFRRALGTYGEREGRSYCLVCWNE